LLVGKHVFQPLLNLHLDWKENVSSIFFLCYTFIRRLDNVFVNWKIPFLVIGVVETGVFWFHLFVCKTTAFLYSSWILWTPSSDMIGWVEFLLVWDVLYFFHNYILCFWIKSIWLYWNLLLTIVLFLQLACQLDIYLIRTNLLWWYFYLVHLQVSMGLMLRR